MKGETLNYPVQSFLFSCNETGKNRDLDFWLNCYCLSIDISKVGFLLDGARIRDSAHLLIALIVPGFFHAALIKIFDIDKKLEGYANSRLIVVFTEFIFGVIGIGLLVENYFTSTNHAYKK